MSDNCQNDWGCILAVCSTKRCGDSSYADERILRDKISVTFNKKFVLAKVASSGSDANMHAVMAATYGDTNALLVAAGSYVAGDGGTMQSMSSSDFSLKIGVSGIARPTKVTNTFTRSHTLALPYCIEGTLNPKAQKIYENDCAKMLHYRCLVAKVKNSPFRAILLELMLASNGASLSDRFLIMLGKISKAFGISVIVDEVMTSGRSGKMLMLQHKPNDFQECVTHITMGKWTQKGLVLVSEQFYAKSVSNTSHTEPRMLSRHVDCRDVLLHWNAVKKSLHLHNQRRAIVLEKLNMKESDTWGSGALIFAPIRRKGLNEGLLNRLLPKLDLGLRVDAISADKYLEGFSKNEVNAHTVKRVKEWLKDRAYEDEFDMGIFKLVKYLVKHHDEDHEFDKIRSDVFHRECLSSVTTNIHRVRAAKLIYQKLVSQKRVRRWIVSDLCRQSNFLIE